MLRSSPRALLGALVALVVTVAPAAAAEPATEAAGLPRAADVRDYWTAERMRAAEPAPLPTLSGSAETVGPPQLTSGPGAEASAVDRTPVANPSAAPFRTGGKVFFTIPGGSQAGDYVCSGTMAESNSLSLVWTAGHCVYEPESKAFTTNWTFVPAYADGRAPFGEWPATELATTEEWLRGDLDADFGAATVVRQPGGRGLEAIIGARPIAFNQPADQRYEAFGYPASLELLSPGSLEFNGERMYSCRSGLFARDSGDPQPIAIECDMTGGASGGGWIGTDGSLLSVSSYKYQTDPNTLFGSYQGDSAQSLYQAASGKPRLCGGLTPTHIGTPGADTLTGTSGADVIAALGGDDTITAGDGRDVVCGGAGADSIQTGLGGDTLRGQGGADRLGGGPGRDLCKGGPDRDRAFDCEDARRI